MLDFIEGFEASHMLAQPTPLDRVRRMVIVVVNSVSSPRTNWDESENPRLLKDVGARIVTAPKAVNPLSP